MFVTASLMPLFTLPLEAMRRDAAMLIVCHASFDDTFSLFTPRRSFRHFHVTDYAIDLDMLIFCPPSLIIIEDAPRRSFDGFATFTTLTASSHYATRRDIFDYYCFMINATPPLESACRFLFLPPSPPPAWLMPR